MHRAESVCESPSWFGCPERAFALRNGAEDVAPGRRYPRRRAWVSPVRRDADDVTEGATRRRESCGGPRGGCARAHRTLWMKGALRARVEAHDFMSAKAKRCIPTPPSRARSRSPQASRAASLHDRSWLLVIRSRPRRVGRLLRCLLHDSPWPGPRRRHFCCLPCPDLRAPALPRPAIEAPPSHLARAVCLSPCRCFSPPPVLADAGSSASEDEFDKSNP